MEWRPIETAPKDDETWVLLADDEKVAIGHWLYDEWRDYSDLGCAGMCGWEPTHWAPLPAPPAKS